MANERWGAWKDEGFPGQQVRVGVDVARYGTDKTTIAPIFQHNDLLAVREIRYSTLEDTMQTTGRVVGVLEHGGVAVVDVIGVGSGVVDRLRELGKQVEAFNAGAKTDWKDISREIGFVNIRSAAWWWMREALSPQSKTPLALPPDTLLTGDLTTPKWDVKSVGKIAVESKDDMRTRIGRSTDAADAVIMGLFPKYSAPSDDDLNNWAAGKPIGKGDAALDRWAKGGAV
jgi:sorbitol-specific phosphotransferase system component IIA